MRRADWKLSTDPVKQPPASPAPVAAANNIQPPANPALQSQQSPAGVAPPAATPITTPQLQTAAPAPPATPTTPAASSAVALALRSMGGLDTNTYFSLAAALLFFVPVLGLLSRPLISCRFTNELPAFDGMSSQKKLAAQAAAGVAAFLFPLLSIALLIGYFIFREEAVRTKAKALVYDEAKQEFKVTSMIQMSPMAIGAGGWIMGTIGAAPTVYLSLGAALLYVVHQHKDFLSQLPEATLAKQTVSFLQGKLPASNPLFGFFAHLFEQIAQRIPAAGSSGVLGEQFKAVSMEIAVKGLKLHNAEGALGLMKAAGSSLGGVAMGAVMGKLFGNGSMWVTILGGLLTATANLYKNHSAPAQRGGDKTYESLHAATNKLLWLFGLGTALYSAGPTIYGAGKSGVLMLADYAQESTCEAVGAFCR